MSMLMEKSSSVFETTLAFISRLTSLEDSGKAQVRISSTVETLSHSPLTNNRRKNK
jgi:hypothetical protein